MCDLDFTQFEKEYNKLPADDRKTSKSDAAGARTTIYKDFESFEQSKCFGVPGEDAIVGLWLQTQVNSNTNKQNLNNIPVGDRPDQFCYKESLYPNIFDLLEKEQFSNEEEPRFVVAFYAPKLWAEINNFVESGADQELSQQYNANLLNVTSKRQLFYKLLQMIEKMLENKDDKIVQRARGWLLKSDVNRLVEVVEGEPWPDPVASTENEYRTAMTDIFSNLDKEGCLALPQKQSTSACGGPLKLGVYQQFAATYLSSPQTKINGLVLFWSPGAGKTIGAWNILRQYANRQYWVGLWVTKFSLISDPLKEPDSLFYKEGGEKSEFVMPKQGGESQPAYVYKGEDSRFMFIMSYHFFDQYLLDPTAYLAKDPPFVGKLNVGARAGTFPTKRPRQRSPFTWDIGADPESKLTNWSQDPSIALLQKTDPSVTLLKGAAQRLAQSVVIIDEAHLVFSGLTDLSPGMKKKRELRPFDWARIMKESLKLPPEIRPKFVFLTATPMTDDKPWAILSLFNILAATDEEFAVPTDLKETKDQKKQEELVRLFEDRGWMAPDNQGKLVLSERYLRKTKAFVSCYDSAYDWNTTAQAVVRVIPPIRGSAAQYTIFEDYKIPPNYEVLSGLANYTPSPVEPEDPPQYAGLIVKKARGKTPSTYKDEMTLASRLWVGDENFKPKLARKNFWEKVDMPEMELRNPCLNVHSVKSKYETNRSLWNAECKPLYKSMLEQHGLTGLERKATEVMWDKIKSLKLADTSTSVKKDYQSAKLVYMWENVQKLDLADWENEGIQYKHYIFSNAGDFGSILLNSALDVQKEWFPGRPLNRCYVTSDQNNLYITCAVGKTTFRLSSISKDEEDNAIQFYVPPEQFRIADRYIVLDDTAKPRDDTTDKTGKLVLGTFNVRSADAKTFDDREDTTVDNSHGHLIRFIVLGKGFREGVDIKDVKYAHLFEPQSTLGEDKQALGRVLRRCGQKGLYFTNDQGWIVNVYIYKVELEPKPPKPFGPSPIIEEQKIKKTGEQSKLDTMNQLIEAALYSNSANNHIGDAEHEKLEKAFECKPSRWQMSIDPVGEVFRRDISAMREFAEPVKIPSYEELDAQEKSELIQQKTQRFLRLSYERHLFRDRFLRYLNLDARATKQIAMDIG